MSDDNKKSNLENAHLATTLVHGGRMRTEYCETSEGLFLTSGYTYPDAETAQARMAGDIPGFVYSRYSNPTIKMLEDQLAMIEGAEACRCTSSGMAAISAALLAPCQQGDRIVAARALFGSCTWILKNLAPRYGIEAEFVDGADLDAWKAALSKPTRLVLIESPSNPLLDGVDIKAIADLAHEAGAELVVDNVFATPLGQKPIQLGADWVVYSCTKHMDGQGRVLAGAILGKKEAMDEIFDGYLKHTGPALSPFNAWVVLKGLETMELRVERMTQNAAKVADFLAEHPAIATVRYPGRKDHPHYDIFQKQQSNGGTLVSFSFAGGQDAAFKALNALKIVTISNNLGDAKTLICHPATTTHRTLSEEERADVGLNGSWVRMSVGLEHADDLISDLAQAFDGIN